MAIRKYTKWVDKCGANPKGIRITPSASAFVRTVCSCGFADAAQVYECPNCGNTEFTVCHSRDTEFAEFPVEFVKAKGVVSVVKRTQYVFLRQEIELEERVETLFSYDGATVNFNRWRHTDEVFKVLRENKKNLPSEVVEALDIMEELDQGTDYRIFTKLLTPLPRMDMFIKMEKDAHPEFVKALVRAVYGSYNDYSDMEFSSMSGFFKEYKVPDEFQEFADKYPDEIIRRTVSMRHTGWRRNPSAVFEAPQNWKAVPEEIKNVAKYYLENGVINFNTYFSLGTIEGDMLKKKKILSLYFKKYMMQFKDRIVYAVNNTYTYLTNNGIDINETTFDEKWCCQRKNINALYENLSRSQADIDDFINFLDGDAVNAIQRLAAAKRTKKAKTSE